MASENKCPHCGKPVPATALGGICPECMLKAGLTETGEVGPGGTIVAKPPPQPVPRVEEIAPHFPQLEILECLGRGGMGVVYKARQPKLDRFVALKILTRNHDSTISDTEFAARFQQEARALARLNHPDIVAVYDFGEAGGYHYLLMEYVDGLTLRQLLQTRKLSPEQALSIVPKICAALQFAHERGIVHRDIKPENILLDKQGQVKIADFGIAKILGTQAVDRSLTGAKDVIGTPHYMAPEQIEKPAKVDHRADIYSLGVVFYEMLTGELPLGNFQRPSRKVQVDVRLDEVVLHALEKEPDRRYQHASEVKTDVETIAASPVTAQPTPLRAEREKSHAAVQRQVKGPAIGLLAAGVLQLVVFCCLVGYGIPAIAREGGSGGGYAAVGFMAVLSLFAAVVVVLGAARMMSLRNYLFVVVSSVVAAVAGPAAILGLPFGIWSLVVLNRRDVREAFGSRSTPAPPPSGSRSGRSPWLRAAGTAGTVFAIVFGLLAIITALLPRDYEAKAHIAIRDEKLSNAKSDEELDWMLRDVAWSFRSPLVLDRVAGELDLRKRWAARFGAADLKEDKTRELLEKQLWILRVPRTALFEIHCFSRRPDEAAEIANKAAEIFCASQASQKAEFVDRATVPSRHARPKEPLNLTFAAAVGLVLGIVFGAGVLLVAALRPPEVAAAPRPEREHSTSAESGWVLAARWSARVLGTLLLVFYGVFVLAEGLPPIGSQPEGVQLNFVALGLMLLGFIVGWKHEGAAALLIASGWTLWQVSENSVRWNLFQTPLPVAALYGFCWWATRGRRTGVVAAAVFVLALALGLGRVFVPTNIFVHGIVRDAQNGKPVPDAELRLLSRAARSVGQPQSPNARAGKDGRFTLYVGWFSDQTPVTLSAPGYKTLTTVLGPRPPHRNMLRDFHLQSVRLLPVESTVPPVVVATFPESGAADVDSTITELRATFSKPMQNGNGAWCKWGEGNSPELTGEPRYIDDQRTCVLPVRLQPGKVYALWLNSEYHDAFKDQDGLSVVPYLLIFQTRK